MMARHVRFLKFRAPYFTLGSKSGPYTGLAAGRWSVPVGGTHVYFGRN